jgi:hypothetical protein
MSTDVVAASSEKPRLGLVPRVVFGLCGAALLVGFFMPWFLVGQFLSMSGFGLVFTSGQLVGLLAGTNRSLLVAVPLLGIVLIIGSVWGHRVTSWFAAGGAFALLAVAFISVLHVFLSSTGAGMWIVVLATFVTLGMGAFGIGRRSPSGDDARVRQS